MDKIPIDISTNATSNSTTNTTETRTLRDVVYNSKRSGGNYGSLAKSQVQPIFYIPHKVEGDDTFQRLALKYTINVQEIKRVNKLWSDAELGLRELIYIPVNTNQLSTLRNTYPNLEVVQSLPSAIAQRQRGGTDTSTTDDQSSIRSSDSSSSLQTTTTTTSNNSSYQDYLSKIDQKIQLTKNSLQSLDLKESYPISQSNTNEANSSDTNRTTMKTERHKGAHHISDNSVFVNIATQNSRDKHVTAALKRIQQEKDDFDEL